MDGAGLDRQETEGGKRIQSTGSGWRHDVCRGIIMAYFLVMTVIYPFYAPGGYLRIGEVKYAFFRSVSIVTLAAAVAVILLSLLLQRDKGWLVRTYEGLSVTDWFVYGYAVATVLSYLCSAYKRDALWGTEGWYMGMAVQLLLAAFYFLFSRYFHCDVKWIGVWLLAAAGVFLLGICNRYSVYPIAMEGQTPIFISTLGNINWFCGYWSVTAAVGITLYWCSDSVRVRAAAALYSIVAVLAGVTQGSESAYPVFLALLILLSALSLGSLARLCRLSWLVVLFALSCLLGRMMLSLPGLRYNYGADGGGLSGVTALLLESRAAWVILAAAALCHILLRTVRRREGTHTKEADRARWYDRRRRFAVAAVAVGICIAAVAAAAVSGMRRGGAVSGQPESGEEWQIFAEDWGNGRGATWNAGLDAYGSMDLLHKIVGIGPDCFADQVYDMPELADRLAEQFPNQRLTNAHNEWLTLLVNEGALGLICYVGIFASAFVRFLKRADRQPLLYPCAAGILAYTVHNMVSFQQVLNVPFAFMLLGIGEKLCRDTAKERQSAAADDRTDGKHSAEKWTAAAGLQTMREIGEWLFAALAVILCLALAFYAKDGYHQIGEAKFAAYRTIMMPGCALLLAVSAAALYFWFKKRAKPQIFATDGWVFAYLIFVDMSVFAGGFYEDVLWGYSGWNMGLAAQVSFCLLYFFASRFGRYYKPLLTVLCAAAVVVYGIGILHRLLIDPIGFYDGLTESQMALFLSTLGQSSWYGSFLAVTLPVGMGVFLYAARRELRLVSGIYMMIGFCTLVTQNSDSAYFALAGVLLVFLPFSADSRETMCRYTGMLALLFAAGKLMYFLMRIHPNPALCPDYVTQLMWTSKVTWALLAVCVLLTAVLYMMGTGAATMPYPRTFMKRLSRVAPFAAVAALMAAALLIVLQSQNMLPQTIADRLADISYFNWNAEWGNGRGRIWRFSAKLFSEADIRHKLFGVGPDCFHSYVAAYYGEEEKLLWGPQQLSNAHNEWLNMLINAGIFGTAAYAGIFLSAIRAFLRGARQDTLLAGIAAACVSYMCYNFFCYQQVLCTPFVFLLLGIGAYILRERKWEKTVDKTEPKV